MKHGMTQTHTQTQQRGFSLIEVLVSLSVFTVVVTICVSTLYTLIEANSRARNSQSIATNLSFTLDNITREIRTGSDYYCANDSGALPVDGENTNDCDGGGSVFAFNEGGQSLTGAESSRRIALRLSEGALQRRLGDGAWHDLTSEDVTIETLRFYAEGTTRGDGESPVVTILLSGVVGDEAVTETDFRIQTTIAQRLLDI